MNELLLDDSSETCALLLAALARRAPEPEAARQHAENDRGAAAAGRVAKQKCKPIGSEVIQWGQVSAARQVGDEKQAKQASETSKLAAMRPEGSRHMVCAQR